MLSYLTQSSSASSSSSDVEKIKQAKHALLAVPSGLVKSTKSKSKKKELVGKTYNPVSARPIANKLNLPKTYTVYLRTDYTTFITSSASVPVFAAQAFTLGSMANSSIYTSTFDQYRIDEIEVWIEPQSAPAATPTTVGLLVTAIDLDDAAVPVSFSVLESMQSSLVTSSYAGHYRKWKPHMAVAVYSGTFTSFQNDPADFIDMASPNVQHYGLKAGVTNTSSVATWLMSIRAKVTFKQTL